MLPGSLLRIRRYVKANQYLVAVLNSDSIIEETAIQMDPLLPQLLAVYGLSYDGEATWLPTARWPIPEKSWKGDLRHNYQDTGIFAYDHTIEQLHDEYARLATILRARISAIIRADVAQKGLEGISLY